MLLSSLSVFSIACFYCFAIELPPMGNVDKLVNTPLKEKPISLCDSCKNLVNSFLKAVDHTSRQNFEGGDADWEREKLGNYENSELRFIEIQETLCSDVKLGKDQCFNLAEQFEHELETWFFEKRMKNVDIFNYLCISQLKFCCPDNMYGPNCIPCPGGIEEPCGGNGKCMNGGTRIEPASCICYTGYKGKLCDTCQQGYYQDMNSSLVVCKPCDVSCKDHCRGPGPTNCEVCNDGYHFVQNNGCIKEDENKNQINVLNQTVNSEFGFEPEFENATSVASQQSYRSEL